MPKKFPALTIVDDDLYSIEELKLMLLEFGKLIKIHSLPLSDKGNVLQKAISFSAEYDKEFLIVYDDSLSMEEREYVLQNSLRRFLNGSHGDPVANSKKSNLGVEEFLASSPYDVTLQAIITPQFKITEGIIVRSVTDVWDELLRHLARDPDYAFEIPPRKWEEIIAATLDRHGYDEVVLTPRSGDYGRDVIASKRGFGSLKVFASVKAYSKNRRVTHDDVRATLGVLLSDRSMSKALITTTSAFAPKILTDPFISPHVPFRLELVGGDELVDWMKNSKQLPHPEMS